MRGALDNIFIGYNQIYDSYDTCDVISSYL